MYIVASYLSTVVQHGKEVTMPHNGQMMITKMEIFYGNATNSKVAYWQHIHVYKFI